MMPQTKIDWEGDWATTTLGNPAAYYTVGAGTKFTVGRVVTQYGYVSVTIHLELTVLDFASNGRLYRRVYDRNFSQKYATTLAKRFAKEIHEKNGGRKPMSEKFETWGILELMGHRRLGGRIIEEERFGASMCRIDIPVGTEWTTQYYGASAIYCVTPTDEATARAVADANRPRPVHPFEIGRMLPGPVGEQHQPDYEDDDDYLDHDF